MSAPTGPNPTRVVILNDYSFARGGATALALLNARMLRECGTRVTFLTGDDGDNADLIGTGVAVSALGGSSLLEHGALASVWRGVYNRATLKFVGDWIRHHDDAGTVYHLHGWSQIFSPSVFDALEPIKTRLVISAHDFFLACPNGTYALFQQGIVCPHVPLDLTCLSTNCDRRSYAHKLWRVARRVIQSRTLNYNNGMPGVLPIHEAMRPLLIRGGVPSRAITTLPNPIRPWSTKRIPAELNRRFVFIGRLNQEKGPDLAAKAARTAGVPLTIVGDGPMREELERDHPEVDFPGHQPVDVVARIVSEARALIMPSRYPEPYGLVLGEAMWSGIPVVLTDRALLANDIVVRGAGIACNLQDSSSLSGALTRIAGDDMLVLQMSRSAFENTKDLGHNSDDWLFALRVIYQSLLS